MTATVDHLYDEALALTEEGRIALAERLIESLSPHPFLLQEQLAEAVRRDQDLADGQAAAIPGESALSQVRSSILARQNKP